MNRNHAFDRLREVREEFRAARFAINRAIQEVNTNAKFFQAAECARNLGMFLRWLPISW